MAIKGNGYAKTTWAFQERPVASSKLNLWDDRIESAIALVYFLLNQAWGGGDGVIRTALGDDLKAVATATPGMSVEVKPGCAFISKCPFRLVETVETLDFAAPSAHPRLDLIEAKLDGWTVAVKAGTEAATPVAPNADSDCIALARVYLRPGMTCIKDTDDLTNGYITDVRNLL